MRGVARCHHEARATTFLRARRGTIALSHQVIDLALNGRPALENLSGRVSLPNARLSDPNLGLSIDPLQATANLQNGLINLDVRGTVDAGGTLRVTGDARSETVVVARTVDADAFGAWLVKIQVDPADVAALLDRAAYVALTGGEA